MVSAKDYRKQDTKLAGPSQKALLPIYCLGPFRLNTGRNLGLNSCMLPLVVNYYFTRVWGQFWPDTLLLGISSCFILVQILSVTLCEMLVLVFCQ